MYTINQVMALINSNPWYFVITACITYSFGFLQYGSSMYMQYRNKECPFYFWQHCWYFGHDLTFVLLFEQWFFVTKFWLFKVLWAGCIVFCFIEFWSLYMMIKNERNETWGKYYKNGEISEAKAWVRGILGFAAGFLLFQVIRLGIGDPMCLVLMCSTNITLAIVTQYRVEELKEKRGVIALALFTFIGTIFNFAPPGCSFFSTVIAALNQPWFYILGVFSLICAGRLVYLAFTLPKSQKQPVIAQ